MSISHPNAQCSLWGVTEALVSVVAMNNQALSKEGECVKRGRERSSHVCFGWGERYRSRVQYREGTGPL